ncbi:hypothetical protein DPEC_G00358500 [Dallia pectoralis]|uniref:Uncharacterized protein n=1 Tax=Dallia pectoralis TaxID=75939 RepID=A0ACC2F0C9_DALPE|nr:hypothetical protein DPEC_G00358500 [Dallia pectoralis]
MFREIITGFIGLRVTRESQVVYYRNGKIVLGSFLFWLPLVLFLGSRWGTSKRDVNHNHVVYFYFASMYSDDVINMTRGGAGTEAGSGG